MILVGENSLILQLVLSTPYYQKQLNFWATSQRKTLNCVYVAIGQELSCGTIIANSLKAYSCTQPSHTSQLSFLFVLFWRERGGVSVGKEEITYGQCFDSLYRPVTWLH